MNALILAAAALLWTSPAAAQQGDDWSALKAEANAIRGELKYQRGDFVEAQDTFRDSLNSTREMARPENQVVGLDLLRAAELDIRRGDGEAARARLEILMSRYPDTDYAKRGRSLLQMLPRRAADEAPGDVTAAVTRDAPEFILARIQAAVAARRDQAALELCRDFLRREPTRPEAGEVRLLGAAMYLRLGDAAGAERSLRVLVDHASGELREKALHLLAAVEVARGDDAAALALVPEPGRASGPWISRAQIWRAAAERRQGRADRAAVRLRAFVDSGLGSPLRAYALAGLAEDFEAKQDYARAQAALESAGEEARRWSMEDLAAGCELSRAALLEKRGKLAEAAAAYTAFARVRQDHPQRALALFRAGSALHRLDRRAEAVVAFSELADKLSRSVYAYDARLHLGQIYAEQGALDRAVAEYEKLAVSGDARGRRESPLLIAQVYYNAKRFKDAVPLYWKFLDENPSEPRRAEVEDLLLNCYWLGDRNDPGLLKAVERFPNHPIVSHIRWELGAQAYKAGDYKNAAAWLARFAAEDPKSTHAAAGWFYLGEARLSLGDARGAAQAYELLLSRHPKSPEAAAAQARLGAALFSLGEYERSAQAYARAPDGPDAADTIFSEAVSWGKAGRPERALAAQEKWISRFATKDARASAVWLAVAEGREKAGKIQSAAAAYDQVTDNDHRNFVLLAAGRLHEKSKDWPAARRSYEALKARGPKNDVLRLRGLLRLALLEEVAGRPMAALPLYVEVMRLSARGGADFKTAAQRLEALTSDGSLVGGRKRGVTR